MAELKLDFEKMAEGFVKTAKERGMFVSRWIPVSERLPEEYGEYLITWTTSRSKKPFIAICEGEVTGEYDHEHNRFKFEWLVEDYIKGYPDVKVIAWMPLPTPFGVEEGE